MVCKSSQVLNAQKKISPICMNIFDQGLWASHIRWSPAYPSLRQLVFQLAR